MKKVDHKPSKRFTESQKLVDKNKIYPVAEAIELVKQTSTVKFDAGVEAHVWLSIDPKKGDQQVRSSVQLPHGTGKTLRIAVVTSDADAQKAAKAAGADLVGEKELIEEIKAGKANFDVLVATPDTMKLLAAVAKILGPKGLMPNPKDGTVTNNIGDAVTNLKKGKISYKNDDSGNVHVLIGRVSFSPAQLAENFAAFIENLKKAKPSGIKGTYIKSITLSSSMGPGIAVENI